MKVPFSSEDAIFWWRSASTEEREEFLHGLLEDEDAILVDPVTHMWEIQP